MRLRLFVEYSADMPVWPDAGDVLDLAALGPALIRRLIIWQRHFDQHYSLYRQPHWSDREAGRWHVEEGRQLREELARAVPDADVVLDLWSVEGDGLA